MIFAQESIRKVWPEATPLIVAHNDELSVFGKRDFSPDLYYQAEDAGTMALFTAREEGGSLCGYALFYVGTHPHYQQKTAAQDSFYMKPSGRGPAAVRFLAQSDRMLKDMGVELIIRNCMETNNISDLYLRFGYKPLERSFLRRL